MVANVIIGFVKDAKHHVPVQGFNVYHRNRLIKVFINYALLYYEYSLFSISSVDVDSCNMHIKVERLYLVENVYTIQSVCFGSNVLHCKTHI
jgi:hypothetical protein